MFEAVKSKSESELPPKEELTSQKAVEKGVNGTRSEVSQKLDNFSEELPKPKDPFADLLSPELHERALQLCNERPAVRSWLLNVARSFEGPACLKLLIENKDKYGNDTIILEQLVLVATFKGSSMLRELLKASDVYNMDYQIFMKFVDVAQRSGPMQLHYLADAKRAGVNNEIFAIMAGIALEHNAINKLLFLIKTKPVYGDNLALFNKMVMLAGNSNLDTVNNFPKLNAAYGNREDLLKVVRGIVCKSVKPMPLPESK